MRVIASFTNLDQAKAFSLLLTQKGIENQCEIVNGTRDEIPIICKIWVFDEDLVSKAKEHFHYFTKNAKNEIYKNTQSTTPFLRYQKIETKNETSFTKEPLGKVTLCILIVCALIFLISQLTTPKREFIPENIPLAPLFSSPIKKMMLYDYPYAFTLIDKIESLFGESSLQNPNLLPKEGKILLNKFYVTPYWQGFYNKIISYFQTKTPISMKAPMFEKIGQGQIWRFFSPCLLHADIFHLFFNMIWLVIIGKQMEKRLGMSRYVLFILLTGIFSNTLQYLMSGSNFIGFSGVLCAMIVFVWCRQKKAPWEGYYMQPATWNFIAFFVLLMFGVQFIAFIIEIAGHLPYSPNIANTAHLSGAFSGFLLGQLRYFSTKQL